MWVVVFFECVGLGCGRCGAGVWVVPGAHRQDARPVPVGDQGRGAMHWLPSSRRARRLEAMRPGVCLFLCMSVGGRGWSGRGGWWWVRAGVCSAFGVGVALVWGGWFAGGFALVLVALLGALVAVAGLGAAGVRLRPRRRKVVAAILGHHAQLVACGLTNVGGGGASRASGGGTAWRPGRGALGTA